LYSFFVTEELTQPSLYSDICKIIFAIILPPLGVFLERGCGVDLLINIPLTILGESRQSRLPLLSTRLSDPPFSFRFHSRSHPRSVHHLQVLANVSERTRQCRYASKCNNTPRIVLGGARPRDITNGQRDF
jgi:hypothetical protein